MIDNGSNCNCLNPKSILLYCNEMLLFSALSEIHRQILYSYVNVPFYSHSVTLYSCSLSRHKTRRNFPAISLKAEHVKSIMHLSLSVNISWWLCSAIYTRYLILEQAGWDNQLIHSITVFVLFVILLVFTLYLKANKQASYNREIICNK